MEFRDLQYFAIVAEHQNIGRAAEALNLSATALSKCLRRLEKSVGAKLVQRGAKGVALTAVGAAILNRIGPLQGMLNDVQHEAADLAAGQTGHLNVGTATGTQEERLSNAYVALSKKFPEITLTAVAGNHLVLSNGLRKGEFDFCIAGPFLFRPSEFIRELLHEEPFVVFASRHHRLASRKQISIKDLAGERWASSNTTTLPQWQALFQAFENNGLPAPNVALKTNSVAMRTVAIAYSDHIGLTSRQSVRQEGSRFPIVELPVNEDFHVHRSFIIYRKGAYLSPAALRLIEILKMQAKEMPNGGYARMK